VLVHSGLGRLEQIAHDGGRFGQGAGLALEADGRLDGTVLLGGVRQLFGRRDVDGDHGIAPKE
jgi:hypothetical protein